MACVAIVDDSEDTLELLEIILKGHHQIISFSDPYKFLEEFASGIFALILLDISMPEMNGYEVFRRIREIDSDVPVCALTAAAGPAEKERALREGFCDYFVKPFLDINRFRQTVYSHIGECSNPPYDHDRPAA